MSEIGNYAKNEPMSSYNYHMATTLGNVLFFGATAFGLLAASIAFFFFKN